MAGIARISMRVDVHVCVWTKSDRTNCKACNTIIMQAKLKGLISSPELFAPIQDQDVSMEPIGDGGEGEVALAAAAAEPPRQDWKKKESACTWHSQSLTVYTPMCVCAWDGSMRMGVRQS